MSTYTLKKDFKCYDDCVQSGCPGHSAEFTYQSTSDALRYETTNGREIGGMAEIETLLTLLAELAPSRVEIDSLINDAGLKLKEATHE